MLRKNVSQGLRMSSRRSYSLKVSSTDDGSAVSSISLVVPGGSRYEPAPGAAHLLEKFAYGNTKARSGLRLTRESELLGGSVYAVHGRENLTLHAKFLREDLPYFVGALASIAKGTLYQQYEYAESVLPLAELEAKLTAKDAIKTGIDVAHNLAFHSGLGNSLFVSAEPPASVGQVKQFGDQVYTKSNIKLFGQGVSESDFVEAVQREFDGLTEGSSVSGPKTSFHSGEARLKSADPLQTVVFGFPTESTQALDAFKYVLSVDGVKWGNNNGVLGKAIASTGASISVDSHQYSDASLLTIAIQSPSTKQTSAAAAEVSAAFKKIASGSIDEDVSKRAVASAKFAAADAGKALELGSFDAKSVADKLVGGKSVLVTSGKVSELPYLEELF